MDSQKKPKIKFSSIDKAKTKKQQQKLEKHIGSKLDDYGIVTKQVALLYINKVGSTTLSKETYKQAKILFDADTQENIQQEYNKAYDDIIIKHPNSAFMAMINLKHHIGNKIGRHNTITSKLVTSYIKKAFGYFPTKIDLYKEVKNIFDQDADNWQKELDIIEGKNNDE